MELARALAPPEAMHVVTLMFAAFQTNTLNWFLRALSPIIFVWGNATTQSITAAAILGTSTIQGQINVAQLMDFKVSTFPAHVGQQMIASVVNSTVTYSMISSVVCKQPHQWILQDLQRVICTKTTHLELGFIQSNSVPDNALTPNTPCAATVVYAFATTRDAAIRHAAIDTLEHASQALFGLDHLEITSLTSTLRTTSAQLWSKLT
jgi:hypothetical protein